MPPLRISYSTSGDKSRPVCPALDRSLMPCASAQAKAPARPCRSRTSGSRCTRTVRPGVPLARSLLLCLPNDARLALRCRRDVTHPTLETATGIRTSALRRLLAAIGGGARRRRPVGPRSNACSVHDGGPASPSQAPSCRSSTNPPSTRATSSARQRTAANGSDVSPRPDCDPGSQ